MPTEQLVLLITFLTATLGAIGAWLSKSYFPHRQKMQEAELAEQAKTREHERKVKQQEADEQARQREHDREQITTKANAELQEESDLLKQMALFQSNLMDRNNQFAEFIIFLGTSRADLTDKNASDEVKAALEKWVEATHQLREIRESLALLVKGREGLEKLPDILLEFITRQEIFFTQIRRSMKLEVAAAVKEAKAE